MYLFIKSKEERKMKKLTNTVIEKNIYKFKIKQIIKID